MPDYTLTIGLEIHAELKTASKMFCGCKNDPDEERPNVHICPICMGHPGTLPVINREAVKKVIQVGTALGGTIADFTEFDRKNYFYPDIPKDYQISQYKYPLVSGGNLAEIEITRVHLEEDTARSSHEQGDYSLVDFNRAGVPLMELVTEPVIQSAEQAMHFGRELQILLQYLGASDANMEKGEMRVEVNISISKDETKGTKVEIKNINSFRAAGRAIEYEYKRQREVLEKGEKVAQETRGFDESTGTTFSQRSKEDSHDYRYFPDPDLPKLIISEISEFSRETIAHDRRETPGEKRLRFEREYAIKSEDIETYINDKNLSDFFESCVQNPKVSKNSFQTLSNYITTDLSGMLKKASQQANLSLAGHLTPDNMADLMEMIAKNEVSSRGAKDILKILFEQGGNTLEIAKEQGLIQKNDPEELKKIMQGILAEHPEALQEYKDGKVSILQFLIGQGMKATKGAGNPEIIKELFVELLK